MTEQLEHLEKKFIELKRKHLFRLNGTIGNDVENLYHYTSLESCLKILETGSIYFTDARFCNDPEEIVNGIEILKKTDNEYKKEIKNHSFIKVMDNILNSLIHYFTLQTENIAVPHEVYKYLQTSIFLSCFSKVNDDLSQWISYGDNGQGVAIKFSGVQGTHQIVPDASIIKTSYATNEAKELYAKSMYLDIAKIYPENDTIEIFWRLIDTYVEDIIASKSSYYEKECEWRLYKVINVAENLEKINFRFSNGLIKPYISCPISKDSVLEIMLGPKAEKNLNFHALNQVIEKYEYKKVKITTSEIRYR